MGICFHVHIDVADIRLLLRLENNQITDHRYSANKHAKQIKSIYLFHLINSDHVLTQMHLTERSCYNSSLKWSFLFFHSRKL